jgi:serine/threonine protein kinase
VDYFRELEILSSLSHPVIVKFLGHNFLSLTDSECPSIILEYAENGSLETLLNKDSSVLTPTVRMKILYGVISAIAFLHDADVIHRDLKPDNIVLDANYEPRLVDFNQSIATDHDEGEDGADCHIDFTASRDRGSLAYTGREVIAGKTYDSSADVVAFGNVMLRLITESDPFSSVPRIELERGSHPELDERHPFAPLIQRCWADDAASRPKPEEICQALRNHQYMLDGTDMAQYDEYVQRIDQTPKSKGDKNRSSFSKRLERDCDYRDVNKIRESNLWIITKRTHKRTGAMVVFKQLCEKRSIEMERDLLHEIEFLAAFSHPAIIQLKGCLVMTRQSIRPAILLDYMESGNLEEFMKTPQWNDTTRMITLIGVASALAYAHAKKVILHDLKPRHILFDQDGHPKLTGLDRANLVDLENVLINSRKETDDRGECYQAPEMGRAVDLAFPDRCDVYSFGRIALKVLSGTFSETTGGRLNSGNMELDHLLLSCLLKPLERPESSRLAYFLSQHSYLIPGADADIVRAYIETLPPTVQTSRSRGCPPRLTLPSTVMNHPASDPSRPQLPGTPEPIGLSAQTPRGLSGRPRSGTGGSPGGTVVVNLYRPFDTPQPLRVRPRSTAKVLDPLG